VRCWNTVLFQARARELFRVLRGWTVSFVLFDMGLDDARTWTILNLFLRKGRRDKKDGLRVAGDGDDRQSLSRAVSSNLTIWAETQD
jgi:hypothetical protein